MWVTHLCDMTNSYVRHSCAKEPYKRDLYSAKETYNLKEPTNRRHPIQILLESWHIHIKRLLWRDSSLQHTATHCNPLQPTATHCNWNQQTHVTWLVNVRTWHDRVVRLSLIHTATHCNTLQPTATEISRRTWRDSPMYVRDTTG